MHTLSLFSVGLLACGLVLAAVPERECGTDTEVRLKERNREDDVVRLEFEVELTADPTCADVTYDLVVDELLPNKQWKSVRLPQRVEVRDGIATQTVRHTMALELELLRYMADVVDCRSCAAEPGATDER